MQQSQHAGFARGHRHTAAAAILERRRTPTVNDDLDIPVPSVPRDLSDGMPRSTELWPNTLRCDRSRWLCEPLCRDLVFWSRMPLVSRALFADRRESTELRLSSPSASLDTPAGTPRKNSGSACRSSLRPAKSLRKTRSMASDSFSTAAATLGQAPCRRSDAVTVVEMKVAPHLLNC